MQYGDPLADFRELSGGPGSQGLGKGSGVYEIGGNVSAPILVAKIEPEYSDEASKWRFRPGSKGGRPVATTAQVEVNFRLL